MADKDYKVGISDVCEEDYPNICVSSKCESSNFTETDDCVFCNKCYLVQFVKKEKDEPVMDEIWEDYKNSKYDLDNTETDSEFSDSDGNYCINDDCCEPSTSFIETTGYILCSECGTIQSEVVSDSQQINYTDGQGKRQNRGQHGTPNNSINPYSDSLATFIPKGFMITVKAIVCEDCGKYLKIHSDKECQDCKSVNLVTKMLSQDLSKIHMRFSYNHKEKSFDIVKNLMENMSINYTKQLTDTALALWAEIMKAKKLTRAGVRKGLIACCMYYSCLEHNCPRTPIEICKDFYMDDTKQFNKGDKEFRETFENSPKWSHLLKKTSESEEFFIRFCNILDIPFSFKNKCNTLYNNYNLSEMEVVPKSAAAGIIYYLCTQEGIKMSKTTISQKLGVCNPTLTKTVKLIEKSIKRKIKKDKKKIK